MKKQALKRGEQMSRMEYAKLAPYAMSEAQSKGRKYDENEHHYRSLFQRDRDRIIHSSAFRRLEYKTQVFVIHEGDYYRTRLTHTIEVTQIARTISRALGLNEDLTEATALAHDLGHTPFGHSGEAILNGLMVNKGGFEHNRQSLRIVDKLEERYYGFPGLNLTFETRECIAKHKTDYDSPALESRDGKASPANAEFGKASPLMEAQVVNIADEIAYNGHDLDDGITSGLLPLAEVKKIKMCGKLLSEIEKKYPDLPDDMKKYQLVRMVINLLCTDIMENTDKNVKKFKIKSVEDVRKTKTDIVSFSSAIRQDNKELKSFLNENLYKHYRVLRMESKARMIIEGLFKKYLGSYGIFACFCIIRYPKEHFLSCCLVVIISFFFKLVYKIGS